MSQDQPKKWEGLSPGIFMENSVVTIGETEIDAATSAVHITQSTDNADKIEITDLTTIEAAPSTPFDPLVKDNDWSHFYQTGQFTDLVFDFKEGGELRAHKMFLIGKSTVFREMLEGKETNENLLIINLTKGVFEAMLKYVYSGKVDKIEGQAVELLNAAQLYALNDLKSLCEKWLCAQITAENVNDLSVLAQITNSTTLKSEADQFMKEHEIPIEIQTQPKKLSLSMDIEQLALITTKYLIPNPKPKKPKSILVDKKMFNSFDVTTNVPRSEGRRGFQMGVFSLDSNVNIKGKVKIQVQQPRE